MSKDHYWRCINTGLANMFVGLQKLYLSRALRKEDIDLEALDIVLDIICYNYSIACKGELCKLTNGFALSDL